MSSSDLNSEHPSEGHVASGDVGPLSPEELANLDEPIDITVEARAMAGGWTIT